MYDSHYQACSETPALNNQVAPLLSLQLGVSISMRGSNQTRTHGRTVRETVQST